MSTVDLAAVIPQPTSLTIKGKEVQVLTLKVKQLSKVLAIVQPFMGAFTNPGSLNIPALLIEHPDAIADLISTLTGETPEWVGELDVAEMIEIFSKVVEVNLAFFTQSVFPSLSRAMEKLSAASPKPTTGQTPSSV